MGLEIPNALQISSGVPIFNFEMHHNLFMYRLAVHEVTLYNTKSVDYIATPLADGLRKPMVEI